MQITRNSIETADGPTDWSTGSVYVDTVAAPSNGSQISASSVHFTPGARTAWHTRPNGQTIWVTEGVGSASAAVARSRSFGPAIASSSSRVRTTGTAPRRPDS
jgi:quercetin dioxygenase-like cupin family protein